MKYSLRSLMIVVAIAPPLLAGIVWGAWLTICFLAPGSKPNYQTIDQAETSLPTSQAPAPNPPNE
jgi:hypothetical protein